MQAADLKGQVFGRLTVIGKSNRISRSGRLSYWHCLCKCGNKTEVTVSALRKGSSKSCGCLTKDSATKHGYSYSPLYTVLNSMKDRCYKTNCSCYPNYGGRGIKICQEWLDSVEAFIKWGESNGYSKGLQIDRKDNDGDYSPENCRFVTRQKNMMNRRVTTYILLDGHKIAWADAFKQIEVSYQLIFIWKRNGKVSEKFCNRITLI